MTQHFLISSVARDLDLRAIYQMSEPEAFERFCALRWEATAGEPVCPACGSVESYKITTRRQFKCRACHRQYSPTSGTILSNRKMSYVDLLAAICIFGNAVARAGSCATNFRNMVRPMAEGAQWLIPKSSTRFGANAMQSSKRLRTTKRRSKPPSSI